MMRGHRLCAVAICAGLCFVPRSDAQIGSAGITIQNGISAGSGVGSQFTPGIGGDGIIQLTEISNSSLITPTGGTTASQLANILGSRIISVTDFGAKCDGSTDDNVALNAATTYLASNPGTLLLPRGTCFTSKSVVFYSNMAIVGQGIGASTIKLSSGACTDILVGVNAYSLFGTNGFSGVPHDFLISGLTLNGNTTVFGTCANPDAANGIAVYGSHYVFRDLAIENIAGHGIRSEAYQFNGGGIGGAMESIIENVTTAKVGRHGTWWKGPHDSTLIKLITIDSSQEADQTYDGVKVEGNGESTTFRGFHGWHNSGVTNRVAYQAESNGQNKWIRSDFEGGRQQFHIATGGDICVNCSFFAPFGNAGQALVVEDGTLNFDSTTNFTCTAGAGNQTYAVHDNRVSISFACAPFPGANAVDLQLERFTTAQGATGIGSALVGGLGNTAAAQSSAIVGGNQNWLQGINSGMTGGLFGRDFGQTSQVFANGRFATLGDAQTRVFVLRCTTSSASACALTADANAPGAANCVNLQVDSAMALQIQVVAFDHTTPANNFSWSMPDGLLIEGSAAANAAWIGGTAVTHNNNAGTVSVAASADTTNGCLSLVFTPPSPNTDTWNAVARVETTEVQ